MNKMQKNENANAMKKPDVNKGKRTSEEGEKNNTLQNKKPEPHHHVVPEEPKYPKRGNTDPFKRESWVY